MSQIVQTPASLQDFDNIWDYIGGDSEKRAAAFIRKIEKALALLAENPEMGRTRNDLETNLRSFPVGNYVIFYEVIVGGIEVLRVLHGARDIPDIFES